MTRSPDALATADLPEAFILIVERQQAIARVVALAAPGAGNEAAEVHSPPVVILSHGKTQAAAARDEEHTKLLRGIFHRSVCVQFQR